MKLRILGISLFCLVCPTILFAGSSCATPTVVPADGRVVDFDFVANGGTNYYQFNATQGHSYSVEVRQDYDDVNNDIAVGVFSDSACSTVVGAMTDTTAVDPAVPANAFRKSLTAATTGTFRITVADTNTTGHYVSVSVSDTTIYNPRWSTHGGFYTAWGFTNTTSVQITGTLTVVDTATGLPIIPPQSVIIAPNSGTFINTAPKAGGLPVPANHSGPAIFSHNGPPGAVVADGFIVNDLGPIIQPVIWEAPRQAKH